MLNKLSPQVKKSRFCTVHTESLSRPPGEHLRTSFEKNPTSSLGDAITRKSLRTEVWMDTGWPTMR